MMTLMFFRVSSFLGFPTWYEYLPKGSDGSPSLVHISDVWLIVLAVIGILLRLAALVAVFGVVTGGVLYVTSQGEPEKNTKARTVIQNALIGLVIAVIAAAVVSFIARWFQP